jgi:eukaryotic-like serine/threonine-protein kinase
VRAALTGVAEPQAVVTKSTWGFAEGAEIVPGRHAVRLLGGGHRYEAYLAWDDALRTLVVVKIVRPDLVDHPGVLAGMAGEARALRRLSHPVIVRSFDAVLEGERPHLVLELLDGPRLSTLVRTSVVAVEQVLSLGLQLSSAAHYLSVRKIVHLDIKPRNVIMAGPPRLIDLSVALPLEELATITTPVGTDAYMAPEQCDPTRFTEIGPPADVWGIGATLYEALAKRKAFPAVGGERFPQLAQRPAPLPDDVPSVLAELVFSTLAPQPADRPTAAELADALEPIVAALPRPRLGRFRPSDRGPHVRRAQR